MTIGPHVIDINQIITSILVVPVSAFIVWFVTKLYKFFREKTWRFRRNLMIRFIRFSRFLDKLSYIDNNKLGSRWNLKIILYFRGARKQTIMSLIACLEDYFDSGMDCGLPVAVYQRRFAEIFKGANIKDIFYKSKWYIPINFFAGCLKSFRSKEHNGR